MAPKNNDPTPTRTRLTGGEGGIPKSKRGRQAKDIDWTNHDGINFEEDVAWCKANLGEAIGYPDMKPNMVNLLKRTFGVNAAMRNVDPQNKNIGELWFEWPVLEDENGNLTEDTETVTSNIEG